MFPRPRVITRFVQLGRRCFIGANVVVWKNLHIGDGSLIAMGAVVMSDVNPETTV